MPAYLIAIIVIVALGIIYLLIRYFISGVIICLNRQLIPKTSKTWHGF
jgi:hypothetical protein